MIKLTGFRKDYAWGGKNFIAELLREPPSDQPLAELWFGDHPQGAAQVDGKTPLNEWLAAHPETLSPASKEKFGDHLPFLLKILDVRLPLSIQLHPNKAQAMQGFIKEDAAGIARDAPERNYQDNNHKPEMMVALSDFWLLHGFAPLEILQKNLQSRPSLAPLFADIQEKGLEKTYRQIMTAEQGQLSAWLAPLLAQPAPVEVSNNPDYWLHYTMKAMNIRPEKLDAGLLSFYLLNIVHLQKGEGIFQAAQLPHAYLRGQNIEIMAASNNVLRAGLTPKHIDIAELLRIIEAKSITPNILKPRPNHAFNNYPAPVDDFTLATLHLNMGEHFASKADEASIILNLGAPLRVETWEETAQLESGEAVLLPAQTEYICHADDGAAVVVLASNQ